MTSIYKNPTITNRNEGKLKPSNIQNKSITMTNPNSQLLSLLPFFSLLLFLHPTSAFTPPPPTSQTANFIHTSCSTTIYPELCYSSLSPYTSKVNSNLTTLATAAIAVSLKSSKHAAMSISLASLAKQDDPLVVGALHDCSSNFEDAIEQIEESIGQMKTLGSGKGSVRFQLSNVQTWMSAALTDAETCTDGFEALEDGQIKRKVVKRVESVKKTMSNALAIVNSLASSKGTTQP